MAALPTSLCALALHGVVRGSTPAPLTAPVSRLTALTALVWSLLWA